MADKPLKSITFPGLADKYMIPEIDSTLTQQGDAADAKKTGDEISGVKNTLEANAHTLDGTNEVLNQLKADLTNRNMPKGFTIYEYPATFTGTYKPVAIFTDGKNYITDFNKERFKNSGGNVMYCAPLSTGASASKAGTFDDPKNLFGALRDVTTGGTVYLKPGVYQASDLGTIINGTYASNMYKNINIVGIGDVILIPGGEYYPVSANKGYDSVNGLYTIIRASTVQVVDKNLYRWEKVDSLESCKAKKGTWYISGSTVYLNSNGEPDVYVSQNGMGFSITPTTGIKLYFENITVIGGYYSAYVTKPTTGEVETIWVNCKFLFGCTTSVSSAYNALRFCGNKCLCVNCEASFAIKDGFGYNEDTGIEFVEINCIGANNGNPSFSDTPNCNGTTAHQGAKGIRINGIYYNNYGANIGDVHENTQTINLGCSANESDPAAGNSGCQGISAQQSGTEMWVENCVAFGSVYDIYCKTGATMHIKNTNYSTCSLNGTTDQIGGYQINATDDLNDYKNPGVYMFRSDSTGNIGNCPSNVRFVLEVLSLGHYVIQRLTTATDIYVRRSGIDQATPDNYGWRAWYKITGTQII